MSLAQLCTCNANWIHVRVINKEGRKISPDHKNQVKTADWPQTGRNYEMKFGVKQFERGAFEVVEITHSVLLRALRTHYREGGVSQSACSPLCV